MMRIPRAPGPLRLAAYMAAWSVLMWLSLAPQDELPRALSFWDKAQHGLAYATLTLIGAAAFPERVGLMVIVSLATGGLAEVLQGLEGLGRQADWRDMVANMTGVAGGLVLRHAVLRGLAGRRGSPG